MATQVFVVVVGVLGDGRIGEVVHVGEVGHGVAVLPVRSRAVGYCTDSMEIAPRGQASTAALTLSHNASAGSRVAGGDVIVGEVKHLGCKIYA